MPFRGNLALSLASQVVGPWGLENEPKRAEKCSYLIAPDMLGAKIGMKWVPVRALKLPTISIGIVFQGEAIGDGGKSPKPYFWGQNGPKNSMVGVLRWGLFFSMC